MVFLETVNEPLYLWSLNPLSLVRVLLTMKHEKVVKAPVNVILVTCQHQADAELLPHIFIEGKMNQVYVYIIS